MKNFMKGIITFVFALMIMLPISVFAATEITNTDLADAYEGDTSKGITYTEGDFNAYKFAEGEYTLGEDLDLDSAIIQVNNANVTFDLNGKTISTDKPDISAIDVSGDSVVTIKGNGTIEAANALQVNRGAVLNVENGIFNGHVHAFGFSENNETIYAYLNIKNGTFKYSVNAEYANVVIDDGTFDTTESNSDCIYVNSGASIEVNGGTFKSAWDGLMAEKSGYYDFAKDEWIEYEDGVKSVVINGGTFTALDEMEGCGVGIYDTDSVEINGGTFIGGATGFSFSNVKNITLSGGTFKSTYEDGMGAIVTFGEGAKDLKTIICDGCKYDPEIEVSTKELYDMEFTVSQKEITVVNSNSSNNTYTFIEGENQEYDPSKDEGATFRINTEYKYFENGGKVYMDGTLVDSSNYTSSSGSTIITFTKEYMKTLASGDHTLKVEFNNGKTATANFKVKGATTANPQTGDNITSYICVFFIGLMAIVSTLYLIKKSENK